VNARLVYWAVNSNLADKVRINDLEEKLFMALGERDHDRRIYCAKALIDKIWHNEPGLGPYPFLDTLSHFEFNRWFYEGYRDHVGHQLKVYLLGLFFIDNLVDLKDDLVREIGDYEDGSMEELRLRWTATSVFHDVGYVLESDHALHRNSEQWKKVRDDANKICRTPISYLPEFGLLLSEDNELKIVSDRNLSTGVLHNISDLETFMETNLFTLIDKEAIASNLATKASVEEEGPALERYYRMALTKQSKEEKRPKFFDHGIGSALLLLRFWKYFFIRISELSNLCKNHRLVSPPLADKIDELKNAAKLREESIIRAAAAMALHNINRDIWDTSDSAVFGLTLRLCSKIT
jgi:hypothetical protein